MHTNDSDLLEAGDLAEAYPQGPAEGGEAEAIPNSIAGYAAARQERLLEFQSQIVKAAEPLGAIVGANTAGLLEIGRRLEEAILERIPAQSSGLADVEATSPAINSLLRVAKQAERYAVLHLRIAMTENGMIGVNASSEDRVSGHETEARFPNDG